MRECIVTVASNMTEETYGMLCEKTKAKFGDDIVFVKRVRDSIIGGFILNIDGMVHDCSLAGQLSEMNKLLREE